MKDPLELRAPGCADILDIFKSCQENRAPKREHTINFTSAHCNGNATMSVPFSSVTIRCSTKKGMSDLYEFLCVSKILQETLLGACQLKQKNCVFVRVFEDPEKEREKTNQKNQCPVPIFGHWTHSISFLSLG